MANPPSAIARQTPPNQLSKSPSQGLMLKPQADRKKSLMLAVQTAFLDRGEALDAIRLDSYSNALMEQFPDDIDTLTVLARLGETVREEFEPIIIPKADLLLMVRKEGWARARAQREAKEAADEAAYREQVLRERAAGEQPFDLNAAMDALAKKKSLDPSAPARKDIDTSDADAV
jgi:hypothetical protein